MTSLPVGLCDAVRPAPSADAPRVGVLALHGGHHEHAVLLSRHGGAVTLVRQPDGLAGLDGLVIPGGESTTMGHLAERLGMVEPLRAFVRVHPVLGTCAGLIFLADELTGQKEGGQTFVGGLDVTVARNFFGEGQVDSFEAALAPSFAPDERRATLFIRAPAITRVGAGVEVLASLDTAAVGLPGAARQLPVAVQQGHLVGLAFHPELTGDESWHAHWLGIVREAAGRRRAAAA